MKYTSFSKEMKKLSIDDLQKLFAECIKQEPDAEDVDCTASMVKHSFGEVSSGSAVEISLTLSGAENDWMNETK